MASSPELADIVEDNADVKGEETLGLSSATDEQHLGERRFEEQGRGEVDNRTTPSSELVARNPDSVDTTRGDGPALGTGVILKIDHKPESDSPTRPEIPPKSVTEHELAGKPWGLKSVNDQQTSNTPDEDGRWTELHAAVEAADEEQVQKLMDRGNLLESAAPDGRKPLVIAAEKGFVKIVELLLRSATAASFNDYDQSTALTRACEERHDAVVRLLIEHGVDIESKSRDGRTPLLIAVSSKNRDLVQYLLRHGADKTVTSEDGTSVEHLAEGDEDLIKLLRENYLVQGPEIGVKRSDPESRFRHVRAPEMPTDDKLAACEAIQAQVVQFFIGRREQRSQPVQVSVFELIYGKGPNALFSPPPTSPPFEDLGKCVIIQITSELFTTAY
ncbi:ankyrin repeat-containing domain protein [Diaporthe sp. PMI_573]|nr:ankyrin repeat-containing domain protein [Diaporthaceae sp. PMI_573]